MLLESSIRTKSINSRVTMPQQVLFTWMYVLLEASLRTKSINSRVAKLQSVLIYLDVCHGRNWIPVSLDWQLSIPLSSYHLNILAS